MVKEDGVCPNGVVLLGVLTTYTHAGHEEEGTDLLEHMEGRYGIVPKHEHYSCTMNLLCRDGQLDKALELIRRMIMKPLASVWGTLLSACSIKGNVELAELAAKELLDLEPSSGVGVICGTILPGQKWDVMVNLLADLGFVWRLRHNILASYLILAGIEWTTQPVFGKDKNGYIRGFGDMFSAELESTVPFKMRLANEKANARKQLEERFALFESRDSPRELQKRRTSDIEASSRSGCSPFSNVYRPSMPVLPRSCELLNWYGATVAYGTLQQGGRASRDFYNILIDEIAHVTKNGPLEDVVAGMSEAEVKEAEEKFEFCVKLQFWRPSERCGSMWTRAKLLVKREDEAAARGL
ncbi:hypothetical protein GIB67_010180 [Kingdonia uniflora]|uniref:Pentatricopeptide repeat-containing protein n=1 Tax=Kingdonia uniflora TaxID=39325 RepID=A0A7J7NB07_9MAGN|nr:hypothetical protein GIB67_010180 [Kingdonia uniflora]